MLAIKAEGLGKSYVIRHEHADRYNTLRDALSAAARGFGRRLINPFRRNESNVHSESFWALQDINFEVREGARVGIIGKNGAGKSTLLKILSRITAPTAGRVTMCGRVSSLLEVGTGFHPELTGRENIFLNGAILGMSGSEIQRKFDDIVSFAEIERFLDTPVKRYSSGMYVRLAFAVSAHLEPEILVVDEVLAVGDVSFQRKCLGRMAEVAQSGRTVLFVSHNMSAVRQLCTSAMLISEGRLALYSDDVDSVIRSYVGMNASHASSIWENGGGEYENPYFSPKRFYVASENGRPLQMPMRADEDAYVTIEGKVEQFNENLTIGYALYTQEGACLYWSYNTDAGDGTTVKLEPGSHMVRSRIPPRLLNEGVYQLELIGGLHYSEWLFEPRQRVPTIYMEVQGGSSDSPYWINKRPTMLAPVLPWVDESRGFREVG
ncbi:MAG: polysaccharide ABC transporter ATP-binding protein [Burkholderiales bacterium]